MRCVVVITKRRLVVTKYSYTTGNSYTRPSDSDTENVSGHQCWRPTSSTPTARREHSAGLLTTREAAWYITREAAVYIISVACVCLPVCNTITFESLDVGSSFLVIRYGIQVKFVYEGHRVKAKVIGAKNAENLYSWNVER